MLTLAEVDIQYPVLKIFQARNLLCQEKLLTKKWSRCSFTVSQKLVYTAFGLHRDQPPAWLLTLTRPIGLPRHAPVAQKIAD